MASVYARELSVAELKGAISFATTELGKKLVATGIKGNEAFSSLAMRLQEKEGARLVEILDRRVREIIQEASADKSCPSASEMRSNKALEARYPECVQGPARGR